MRRTAYLVHGRYFQHAIMQRRQFSDALTAVYLPTAREENLAAYDTVIVSSAADPDLLASHASGLVRYWRAGGDLVCLGAPPLDWLPGARYEPRLTNFWWYREPGADLRLIRGNDEAPPLRGLSLDTLKWHHHGVYHPPAGAETLLATEDGASVLYTHREPGSGLLTATTMDPDSHTGLRFIPKAEQLFAHLVDWAARP